MYILLVCPNLEYASQVWNPYKAGEVNSLEHVQKFALCMCTKSWDSSYQDYFSSPYQISSNAGFTWICAKNV